MGGSGNSGSPPPAAEIQPLPPTTFVFYRLTAEPPEGKRYAHLWAFDVVTKQERLISKLDNSIGGFTTIAGDRLSISPDRRWIAFSAHFRPSNADAFLAGRTSMIWKVSADGQQFVRISAPLVDFRPACSAGCAENTFCEPNSNRCTYAGWMWNFEHPSWSPDGKTIFAHLGMTACRNISCLPSTVLPNVPALTSISDSVAFSNEPSSTHRLLPKPEAPLSCNTGMPVASPDGKRLVYDFAGCFSSDSWGILVSNIDGTGYQKISDKICAQIQWRADSAAVYCSDPTARAVFEIGLDKSLKQILSGQKNMVHSHHFTFSASARWFVLDIIENGKPDLYFVDLQATPLDSPTFAVQRLTTDGSSAWPAF